MSYYQENRPSMGGLADALAMQGRRGDSTLVHMNPMEVRMLESMSPDGRLSINPETGLPEAFKLKDLAAIALPIAAGAFLGPAAAGFLGSSALTGTAVATGLGGVGAGLLQGKGVKDSLIQGGLSGLMSYGLGSLSGAFAPSGGVTAGPPTQATMASSGPALMSTAPDTAGAVATAAAPEPTGFFGGLGETLKQTPFTDVPSVGSPTYGSMLGSGASGLLASGLTAEEMPYDVADVGMDYPYYDADLAGGRLRGQAAARQLQSPPSFLTSGGLYERATSPGGGGTFFAADGGQVPKPYGDPYGPGDPYGGMADETDFGQPSGTGQSADVGPGMSLGSFNEPVADFGFGSFNPTPMSLGLTALGMVPGPIGMVANIANIGRGLVGLMGPSVPGQVSGFGTTTGGPTDIGIGVTGQAVDPNFEAVSNPDFDVEFDFNPSIGDPTGVSGDTSGASGTASTAGAVGDAAGESTADPGGWAQGGVIQAGIGGLLKALSPAALATDTLGIADVDKLKAKDMLGMLSPAAFFAKDPKRLKYLSPAAMAAERPSALSPAATVMMNRGMAQGGGISSLAYGGEAAPVGFANKAFEGMVPGQGTGMSDDVPFSIEGNQPALLSRDEYVLPADVVSQLGDGSSGAGADMLDNFISQVRQSKYGNTQQPAPVGPQLMTGLMKQGGVV